MRSRILIHSQIGNRRQRRRVVHRNHRHHETGLVRPLVPIHHLGRPDGGVADADPGSLVAEIAAIVDAVSPDVVVTFGPDGLTGHPDHVACSHLTTHAWLDRPGSELWYATKAQPWLDRWRDLHDEHRVWITGEPVAAPTERLAAHLDLTGSDLTRKRAVLAAHASQTESLVAALGEGTYRQWIAQESFRWAEAGELAVQAASKLAVTS